MASATETKAPATVTKVPEGVKKMPRAKGLTYGEKQFVASIIDRVMAKDKSGAVKNIDLITASLKGEKEAVLEAIVSGLLRG